MWKALRTRCISRGKSLYVSVLRHVNSENPQGVLVRGKIAVLVAAANGVLAAVLAGIAFFMGEMTYDVNVAFSVLFPIGFGVVTFICTWVALHLMKDPRL